MHNRTKKLLSLMLMPSQQGSSISFRIAPKKRCRVKTHAHPSQKFYNHMILHAKISHAKSISGSGPLRM